MKVETQQTRMIKFPKLLRSWKCVGIEFERRSTRCRSWWLFFKLNIDADATRMKIALLISFKIIWVYREQNKKDKIRIFWKIIAFFIYKVTFVIHPIYCLQIEEHIKYLSLFAFCNRLHVVVYFLFVVSCKSQNVFILCNCEKCFCGEKSMWIVPSLMSGSVFSLIKWEIRKTTDRCD